MKGLLQDMRCVLRLSPCALVTLWSLCALAQPTGELLDAREGPKVTPTPELKAALAAPPKPPAPPPAPAPSATPSAAVMPSADGPIGLDRVWSAELGPVGRLRMRGTFSWFDVMDFPISGAHNRFTGGELSLAYTPLRYLETFFGVRSTSNANDSARPTLIQTQGDLVLGAKAGLDVSPMASVAAGAALRLFSGLGDSGLDFSASSLELKAIGTTDLHRVGLFPLKVHFEMGYTLDNSEAVLGDDEVPTLVQEFALRTGRYDRMILGIGLEAPLSRFATPYLEYRIGTPFLVDPDLKGEGSRDFAFGSIPHTLTPGVRAFPFPDLAVDAAVRLGLSSDYYTGVPMDPPWMVVFGLAYAFNPAPAPPAPVTAPLTAVLTLSVQDEHTRAPIAGAQVSYPGRLDLSPQLTDAAGRVTGYALEPGPLKVELTAKGYQAKATTLTLSRDLLPTLALTPAPTKGKLEIKVLAEGKTVEASLELTAADRPPLKGQTSPKQPFLVELAPGEVTITAKVEGRGPERRTLTVIPGETTPVELTLPAKPKPESPAARALVSLEKKTLVVRRGVDFVDRTTKLTASGRAVLDDLAAVLQANPKLTRLRIDSHVDDSGQATADRKLSEDRARAVQSYLVSKGINAKRLSIKAFGAERPVAPNLTARGREKNRRVEFTVQALTP